MRSALLSIGLTLALAACGPRTIGDLPRPALVLVVQQPGAFCSATYAVDASDRVWLESGCETSSGLVESARIVTSAERAELDALMDRVLALPDDPSCEVPSPSARRLRFVRTTPGTEVWSETRQCEPTLAADARELLLRMESLIAAPTDAGARDAGPRDAAGSDGGP